MGKHRAFITMEEYERYQKQLLKQRIKRQEERKERYKKNSVLFDNYKQKGFDENGNLKGEIIVTEEMKKWLGIKE